MVDPLGIAGAFIKGAFFKWLSILLVVGGGIYIATIKAENWSLQRKVNRLSAENAQLIEYNAQLRVLNAESEELIASITEQCKGLLRYQENLPKRGTTDESKPVDDDFLDNLFKLRIPGTSGPDQTGNDANVKGVATRPAKRSEKPETGRDKGQVPAAPRN